MTRRRQARQSRLRLPLWLPVCALLVPLGWIGWRAQTDARAKGFGSLDPATLELDFEQGWVDARWLDELSATLTDFGPVHLNDGDRLRAMARATEALPFVAEAAMPRVAWPAGVSFDLRLRRPVACVLSGDRFFAVDAEGVVLPGSHGAPPSVESGFLPLLGPPDGRFGAIRPGERLSDPADIDALAIAASLWLHLGREERSLLGRISIEAAGAAESTLTRPGAVLRLEGARSVAFGRSPLENAPGELALHTKWSHVAAALRRIATDPEADWVVLDARYDQADYEWRSAGASGEE